MKSLPNFEIGTRVSWVSQAKGFSKLKSGTVVEVALPGQLPDRGRWPGLYQHSGVGSPRRVRSYVVQVSFPGTYRKPALYWPRTSALNVADESAPHEAQE